MERFSTVVPIILLGFAHAAVALFAGTAALVVVVLCAVALYFLMGQVVFWIVALCFIAIAVAAARSLLPEIGERKS